MKHRIIIILSLLTMGFIPSLAEDIYFGVALLSHQGKQTAYAADNVQAAVDAAVEGDTIHFAPGRYKDITLNKKVYLQNIDGAGLSIYLQLPGNPIIESSLFIGGSFDVYAKCNLQSIYFTNFYGHFEVLQGYRVENVTYDRCYVWDVNFENFNVGKLQANNCQIDNFYNGSNTATVSEFKHCNFRSWHFSIINASFENCILYNYNEDAFEIDKCLFTRCMYDPGKYNFAEGYNPSGSLVMEQVNWNDSKENLETLGLLGNDNTLVGMYGGTNPYDRILIPRDYPYIWRNGEFKMQGKTIIGNWFVNPTR